jgi:SHS2 domain-containing protein
MPYTYLEDIVITDVAFRATGKTLEEVFAAAADATLNVMVEDLTAIRDRERIPVQLENEALDLLLYDFLREFVYFKDARGLLLRSGTIRVRQNDSRCTVMGELYGEPLDLQRHA